METQNKFQNKRLNKEDHKKIDTAAKNLRTGAAVAGFAATLGIAIKKFGPEKVLGLAKSVVKTVVKSITRV